MGVLGGFYAYRSLGMSAWVFKGRFYAYRSLGMSAWVFKEGFMHIDLWGCQHGCLKRVFCI